jgi:hypothetical protein
MEGKRVAVVVSHPAHLLTIVGMLQRWRPSILLLYRSVVGAGVGQEQRMLALLRRLGLGRQTTSLGVVESESHRRALSGDVGFHLDIGRRVLDWLLRTRPDAVVGDAFEAYNFHHDITRALLDDAVCECRARGGSLDNYEIPLTCRPDVPGAELIYGTFPTGDVHTLRLTAREAGVKRRLVAEAARLDPFIAEVAPLFPDPGREVYRTVPEERDYTQPPEGLALYYDELGRDEVAAGRYVRAITFAEHFVPVVRSLRPALAPAA